MIGAWRSLVAHLLWEQRVAGSNPAAPTMINKHLLVAIAMATGKSRGRRRALVPMYPELRQLLDSIA
jgi:hypothetical protein